MHASLQAHLQFYNLSLMFCVGTQCVQYWIFELLIILSLDLVGWSKTGSLLEKRGIWRRQLGLEVWLSPDDRFLCWSVNGSEAHCLLPMFGICIPGDTAAANNYVPSSVLHSICDPECPEWLKSWVSQNSLLLRKILVPPCLFSR